MDFPLGEVFKLHLGSPREHLPALSERVDQMTFKVIDSFFAEIQLLSPALLGPI